VLASRPTSCIAAFLVVLISVSLMVPMLSAVIRPAQGLKVSGALTEWAIPTMESRPAGLTLDPSGKCCWFVESAGNKVVHLDPSTDTFRQWTIPTPDSAPTSIAPTTISDSMALLGTEFAKNKIFLFFPETGNFREYELPTGESGPQRISIEPGGTKITAWFTEAGTPSKSRNTIGQIVYDPASATVRLLEVALPAAAGGGANDVQAGSGIVWFAGFKAIVKFDRSSNRFTSWPIPAHGPTRGAFLDVDSLGQVWYTSGSSWETNTSNYVVVLRADNTVTEWQIPTLGADVRVVSVSPLTQNPWFTEYGGDKVAKLDPSSGGVISSSAPSNAPSTPEAGALSTRVAGPVLPSTVNVSPTATTIDGLQGDEIAEWMLSAGTHPEDIVVDASGEVWMLETSGNKVARLSLTPDFNIECDPSSLIVVQGTDQTSLCEVNSVGGFNSAVQLAGSWVGEEPSGVSYTLLSPITPPPGRSVSSRLIVSAGATASPGTFMFQVSGTSGSLSHNVHVDITVSSGAADFTVTVSPSYLPVSPGGSGTATVTIQSVGVFHSPVELSTSGAPNDMRLSFATNPVTPPIGSTISSILTVEVSGAPTGTYTLTIAGTSSSVARSTSLTVEVSGGCLIATATYGSELSDEVQFLREFRDNSILKTRAGTSFMVAFDAWYYSFSPSVAQFIRGDQTARTAAKFVLYPLLGILEIGAAAFNLFPACLEASAVLSGLAVSSLIGAVYLAAPLGVLLAYSSRSRRIARRLEVSGLLVLCGALVALTLMLVLGAAGVLTMIATSTIVLSTLTVSALLFSQAIASAAKHLSIARLRRPLNRTE
jgi:streptogramin lyase